MKTSVIVRHTEIFMSTGCNTMLTHYPEVNVEIDEQRTKKQLLS
jgi:hypothetical protein